MGRPAATHSTPTAASAAAIKTVFRCGLGRFFAGTSTRASTRAFTASGLAVSPPSGKNSSSVYPSISLEIFNRFMF